MVRPNSSLRRRDALTASSCRRVRLPIAERHGSSLGGPGVFSRLVPFSHPQWGCESSCHLSCCPCSPSLVDEGGSNHPPPHCRTLWPRRSNLVRRPASCDQ